MLTETEHGAPIAAASQVAPIEKALDGLLTAILNEETRTLEARATGIRATPFVFLSIADLKAETEFTDLARDPIGTACRKSIRRCGEALFRLGGADLMHATIERVAEMDDRRYGARLDITDKNWNGIGEVWWS